MGRGDAEAEFSPLDVVLALANAANTPDTGELLGAIEECIVHDGDDVRIWLRAVLTARDVGVLSADAAYYLLTKLTETAVGLQVDTDPQLRALMAEIDAIERREGLTEDEAFRVGEGPPDYERANRDWDRRFDELQVDVFRDVGAPDVAADLRWRKAEFDSRSSAGWAELMAIGDDIDQ